MKALRRSAEQKLPRSTVCQPVIALKAQASSLVLRVYLKLAARLKAEILVIPILFPPDSPVQQLVSITPIFGVLLGAQFDFSDFASAARRHTPCQKSERPLDW